MTEPPGDRLRQILEATTRYQLSRYVDGDGPMTFPGPPDDVIRPPSAVALGLASAASTGVSASAEGPAVRLATSLALAHVSSTPGGWGRGWQTSLWASYAGLAAWLLWSSVPAADRARVEAMVASEADHVAGTSIPYWRDRRGVVLTPGDTKAEENAWRARVLHLAVAMLPGHPHESLWTQTGLAWLLSSYARAVDVVSEQNLHQRPMRAWVDGSNIEDSGLLENHGRHQPDYMVVPHHAAAAVHASLAGGRPVWRAALHNLDLVYAALADVFYRPDGSIHYPGGDTWGTGRRIHFLLNDVEARVLGFDWLASTPAAAWESIHADAVLAQIARSDDGRVYVGWDEFRSTQREEEAIERAGQAYLVHRLGLGGPLSRTNAAADSLGSRTLTRG